MVVEEEKIVQSLSKQLIPKETLTLWKTHCSDSKKLSNLIIKVPLLLMSSLGTLIPLQPPVYVYQDDTKIVMSFLTSFQQLVSDAGSSLSAISSSTARKLVSTISQDSSGSEVNLGPNIEVFSAATIEIPSHHENGGRKRPTGPLLIPSPETAASLPLSPSHFSSTSRRPSLAVSPSAMTSGRLGTMLDPMTNSVNLG